SLITKVYFPRVLLPAGASLAGLLDFAIASLLLVGLMFYYHVPVSWLLLLTPIVVILMVVLTLGLSLLTAALNVRYRDVRHLLPFVVQLWMFATPVIYSATMIPERFRPILALNPAWAVVDGFRFCLLPNLPINLSQMAVSVAVAIAIFAVGLYYF